MLWGCCGVVGLGFMASAGCRQPHTLLAMNASNPKAVMPQSRYDAAILRDFLFVFFRFFQNNERSNQSSLHQSRLE